MAINIPSIKAKIVTEDLKPTQVFFRLISSITSFINEQPIILDFPGSPEGNLNGRFKDQCWDAINNKLYFKSTASGDTGWILIN